MSINVISFSARKNGNCAKIGEFIGAQFDDVKFYNFADFNINACGNCDYQCFRDRNDCPYIDDNECKMLDAITHGALTFFIVPNYCDYPCANFFIFNERSLCYFRNNEQLLTAYLNARKKFIVISNTDTKNFRTAFSYHCAEDPEILFLTAKKYGKNSIDGDLMTSQIVKDKLLKFAAAIEN